MMAAPTYVWKLLACMARKLLTTLTVSIGSISQALTKTEPDAEQLTLGDGDQRVGTGFSPR